MDANQNISADSQPAQSSNFASVQQAISLLASGKMIILMDNKSRENEGDLVIAAQFTTPQEVNFMITNGKGLLCTPINAATATRLNLPPMVASNSSKFRTNFTVSVNAAQGTTTGISALDRATTIAQIANPLAVPESFQRPGHVFPLIAHEGGIKERQGHTEASVELMRLAGLYPAAAICEIINEDGTMARLDDLTIFAEKHGLKIAFIDELCSFADAA